MVKIACVVSLTESTVESAKLVQPTSIIAPISDLNLGLHEIKTNAEAEFIATKRLLSDIDQTLES